MVTLMLVSIPHLMQGNGIRPDQVTQVRGFADQQLRKPEAPLDPGNRRISLIVQYIVKNRDDDEDTKSPPESNKTNDGNKPSAPAEKPSGKE